MTVMYKIIEEEHLKDFESKVAELLLKGWELAGGVAVSTETRNGQSHSWYAQALVNMAEVTDEKLTPKQRYEKAFK